MAVHDDLAEIGTGEEELVADPQQVLHRLTIERNARLDPGMDEIEIAFDMTERELAQEREMTRRQPIAQLALSAREVAVARRRLDTVGPQRRTAAIGEPGRSDLGIGEETQHAVLVVAEKMNALEAGDRAIDQPVDHLARALAAIDIVAEIDDDLARPRRRRGVVLDAPVDLAQEVGAAMDVADRVGSRALRDPGETGIELGRTLTE